MVTSKPARLVFAIGIAGVAALLAACQPSMEEVVAGHRPAVEAVFAKLRALDATVAGTPRVGSDRIDVGSERVVLDGDTSNALFILAPDLDNPETASSERTGATRASTIEGCGEALRGEFRGIAKGADLFLSECARAEYVFVLRPAVEQPARLVDSESFEPGTYEGDVLLFRLADGALLGGFAVAAASSDQISVEVDSAGNPIDPIAKLNSDMTSRVFVEIDNKLRALVPGVIPEG